MLELSLGSLILFLILGMLLGMLALSLLAAHVIGKHNIDITL
jgi:hypothetical protein